MILADENIDADIVSILQSNSIDVLPIKENHSGISDEEIIRISKRPPKIILTEDKDFGEWVFAHQERNISVILLRYSFPEKERIVSILLELLKTRGEDLFEKFTTISVQKVRVRSIK